MDLVVASSRGRNIGQHLENPKLNIPIITTFQPSATYQTLINIATKTLHDHSKSATTHLPSHIYFLAGIPDITSMEHNHNWSYKEVVFWETPEEAASRVSATIANAEAAVKELGAIPCFCTVAPMSIDTWNTIRLKQKKTTHLKHTPQYSDMQTNHEKSVTLINQYIYTTNTSNNMHTPRIAEHVFKSPGANRVPRLRVNRFVDGVHPDPLVSVSWASEILDTTILNRSWTLEEN